jgi:hypothetical protein
MSTAVHGGDPRRCPRPPTQAVGQRFPLPDITRAITVIEALGRVESDLAATLRSIAARDTGATAARRLGLAEDAARAALAAASIRDRLQQARWRAEHADAATTPPGRTPPADTPAGRRPQESATSQRLDEISRRLAELRRARASARGDSLAAANQDPRQRAEEARRHMREATAHLLQARLLAIEALRRAASAHDRAAEACARSARLGIDDVAEHHRRVAFHRAAADADRQQAQVTEGHAADAADNHAG